MSKFWATTQDSDSDSDSSDIASDSDSDNFSSNSDNSNTVSWDDSSTMSGNDDNDDIKAQIIEGDEQIDEEEELMLCIGSGLIIADDLEVVNNSNNTKMKNNFSYDENDVDDSNHCDVSLEPNLAWEQIRPSQIFLDPPTTITATDSITSPSLQHSERKNVIRLVCMSDTHGQHHRIPFVPKGDVFIHGGDFTKSGETGTVVDFLSYLEEQRERNGYKQIICIAGNHEATLDWDYYNNPSSSKRHKVPFDPIQTKGTLSNSSCVTYLEDSSTSLVYNGSIATNSTYTPLLANEVVAQMKTHTATSSSSSRSTSDVASSNTSNDTAAPGSCIPIEVYGTPWTPEYNDWAFNLQRGEPLRQMYTKIPTSTDILVSHGPPLGRGDAPKNSGHSVYHVGCLDLLQEVQNRIQPRIHIYGHVHEGYGVTYDGKTLYVNASNLRSDTDPLLNPCIVIDIPIVRDKDDSKPPQPARIVPPNIPVKSEHEFLSWLKEKRRGQDYCYDNLRKHVEEESTKEQEQREEIWKRIFLSLSFPQKKSVFVKYSYESAYHIICETYHLHRDKKAREELCDALCELYAESF